MTIRRKQIADQDEWVGMIEQIRRGFKPVGLSAKIDATAERIRGWTRGKAAAVSWSGGKDSIVLGHLADRVGVRDKFIVLCDLEYPSFLRWLDENEPVGLRRVHTGQDIEWLAAHPNMLFPSSSAISSKWFSIVQHTGQRRYFKEHDLDVMLLGRRWAEGNYTGRGDRSMVYTDARGVTRASPLADWTHEDILAYMIQETCWPIPSFYYWPRGFRVGTGPWAKRRPGLGQTRDDMWAEVGSIDPSILEAASRHFQIP